MVNRLLSLDLIKLCAMLGDSRLVFPVLPDTADANYPLRVFLLFSDGYGVK